MDEKTQVIPNSFIINVISFIITLVTAIFLLLPLQILQFIAGNIISVFLLSIIGTLITGVSFILWLEITSIILFILSLISNFKLLKESFMTQYNSTISNIRFSVCIKKYRIANESSNASQPIKLENKRYVVAEYGTYKKNPTDQGKLTGFLILNHVDGTNIQDSILREKILKVYLMWRYIYFNAVLDKDIKINKTNAMLIKSRINFQNKLKLAIEDWSKDDYKKVKGKYDEKFVKILRELDSEVLTQYPLLTEKLNHQLWIIKNIYILFEKPSYELYEKLYQKINKIQELGTQENQIWNKRLSTWEKLYSYEDEKIKNMPNPKLNWLFRGILGDVINFVIFQLNYPIGGATISGILIEAGKKINKEGRRLINKIFTYHILGIDSIRKNIEINQRFEEIRNEYRNIWNNPPVSKIRY